MLKMEDLLNHKYEFADQDVPIQDNLMDTLDRVTKVEAQCSVKNWVGTSGLRAMVDHLRIYRDKAAKKQKPFEDGIFDESKVPKKSKHLDGTAWDIADPGLKITAWLKANPKVLEDNDLYCEEGNENWVHFQTKPFGSYKPGGTRWFKP